MSAVNIKVQIQCLQPNWVATEKNIYRLYINNDMLTERSWIWDTNTIITENIWVNIDLNTVNSLRFEPILNPIRSTAKFRLQDLRINDIPTPFQNNDLELSFKL